MAVTLMMDSSYKDMILGLAQGEVLLARLRTDAWQKQSESMMPSLVQLLKNQGFSLQDVDRIVVGKGPGSYTGTRIALTIAKTLGLMKKIPIFPVSSLHVYAHGTQPTLVLMDARAGRSFVGVYQGTKTLIEDTVWTNEEVLEYLKNHPTIVVRGKNPHLPRVLTLEDPFSMMLALGNQLQEPCHPHTLKPFYVKESI